MAIILLCAGFTLLLIGALAGRVYERNIWQRRLLERAGLIGPDLLGLRRLEMTPPPQTAPSASASDALDAMALEIERISEGQRFLTKILAERERRPTGGRTPSPMPGTTRSAPM